MKKFSGVGIMKYGDGFVGVRGWHLDRLNADIEHLRRERDEARKWARQMKKERDWWMAQAGTELVRRVCLEAGIGYLGERNA